MCSSHYKKEVDWKPLPPPMVLVLLAVGYVFVCCPSTPLERKLHEDREFVCLIRCYNLEQCLEMDINKYFLLNKYMNKWMGWLFVHMDGWKDQHGTNRGFLTSDAAMLFFVCKLQVPIEAPAVICNCLSFLEKVAKKILRWFRKLVSAPNLAFYPQLCDYRAESLGNVVWAAWRRRPWGHAVR